MKLAVWYHCRLSGGEVPINTTFAATIMAEQMQALHESGLLSEAEEFCVGINGEQDDVELARLFVPCPHAHFVAHGSKAVTEIPTLTALRDWLNDHRGWFVLYHHIKGVTHPTEPLYVKWRHCMERALIWNWRRAVADLEMGNDMCGCHWLTPQRYPNLVNTPFWGGTFWWAQADYLLKLPPLPEATWHNRYEAERWVGKIPRPRVRDYHPIWPGENCLA